jgi:hypothetical protein
MLGLTLQRPSPNFRVIAMIVASAMCMEQLDATVLATALPAMARDCSVSAPAMSIVLNQEHALFKPGESRH